jgi:formylmethanofuran dehydrogenase subunit D
MVEELTLHSSQQTWNVVRLGRQNDRIHKDMAFIIFGIYAVNIISPSKKSMIVIPYKKHLVIV